MPKRKSVKKIQKNPSLKHHFPTFYEQPLFAASILLFALVAVVLTVFVAR
ncbi:MAG TPA: hypothetical protein VFQ63_03115 [Patescibacteria group bacterium]|nr:hypothetical protein [Patescibacteria group bacterium]